MHAVDTSKLIQRLASIPYICAISDVLDEMGLVNQVLPQEIRAICDGQSLAGQALTIVGEATTSVDPRLVFLPYLRMQGEIRPGLLTRTSPRTLANFLVKQRSS